MYQEMLNDITYEILFSDFEVFNKYFWDGCNFISTAFYMFWGIKIGAKFLRDSLNLW